MIFDLAILILASVSNLALGSLVFMRNPQRAESRAFFGISLSITAWTIFNYLTDRAPTLGLDQFFARLDFGAGFLVLATITLFAFYFGGKQSASKRRQLVSAVIIIAGTIFSLSDFVVGPVSKRPDGGTNVALGSLYTLYPIFILVMFGLSCYYLWKLYRNTGIDLRLRAQTRLIMLGIAGFIILAVLTNIVIPAIVGNWDISRIGPLLTVFLVGSVSYAIVKHRLFSIRLAVARSVAYLLLLTTFIGLYGITILAASNILFQNNIPLAQTGVFVALALFLAITFQPLRRLFEKVTDSIFFRDRYDSQIVLDDLSEILTSELLLEPLLKKSLRTLCWSLRIATGQIIIVENNSIYSRTFIGDEPRYKLTYKDLEHINASTLVADELEPGATKSFLEEHGLGVIIRLSTEKELVGYLFLGYKMSGEMYSGQDLTLLDIVRKELAVAIENAKSYEEIAHFNATLQERIRNATHRLRTANRNLQVLDKTKDDFISMASHQLGTPLTAITGYLSMALDDDQANMTVKQREYVNYALEAAERMVSMSSDLLNVSRLSSGRFMIQRQPVDLSELAQQEVQQLRPSAERKKLELIFKQPDKPLPMLSIDESKTRQVIMNFIDNAIYYTPKGSVTVEVRESEGAAEVLVIDSGIGVPENEKRHLFSKFYRAENAKAERPDGTGLGLYLAKRVIEDQGGSIIFKSEEGKGSIFGFALPLKTTSVIVLPQPNGAAAEAKARAKTAESGAAAQS
ncbi:MAG TPA: ATP-binding protein [Candidatus Saccharimonadia bacterium]|nr:ATP-binding protein [Candidatus Saccharimonadia bacterium]